MAFHWQSNLTSSLILTIYETNLTLNQSSRQYFEDIRYVLLGIDDQRLDIGIKPVTKNEIDQNLYPIEKLHKVSVGKSYIRITNRHFQETLIDLWNLDFHTQKSYKIALTYDDFHKVLIAKHTKESYL